MFIEVYLYRANIYNNFQVGGGCISLPKDLRAVVRLLNNGTKFFDVF